MAAALSPQLQEIRAELDSGSSRARSLVERVRPDRLARRPDENSWSVAECIAHLTLTSDAYLPLIRQALEEGRRQQLQPSGAPFRMEFSARMLAWWLEPPYRMKSKTPAAFVPGVEDAANVLPDFLERQRQLDELLDEAGGLALDKLQIASPFAKQMRYNVYSAFRLIAAHQRRHLWQAEQAAGRLGV